MKNFWDKLKKLNRPLQFGGQAIYALAPMAGFTDSAFRQICKEFGADVLYSEMASATALVYSPKKTLELIEFDKQERPYVVRLFGSDPKHFEKAVKLIGSHPLSVPALPAGRSPSGRGRSIDGIDINFGCPVKKVAKQGAGAVLMNNLKLSKEIIKSVIDSTDLPVSIKCRVGTSRGLSLLGFLENINDLDIKAVMIHGRTLAQGFSGPINTEIIKKARDYYGGIILANGGVNNYDDAVRILDKTKADGLGIARGALGRPWIFKAIRTGQSVERTAKPIFKIALKHAKLAFKLKGKQGLVEMRKHLCAYVQGLPGAKEMRRELVKIESIKDIEEVFN